MIAAALALWAAPAVAQTVDADMWVPNGPVFAVVRQGNTIYIGGRFTSVGPANGGASVTRRSLAAFDATTGALTSWNPSATGGEVDAMAVSGNTVYAGGSFTDIGGQPRSKVGAVDAVSGLATDWAPDVLGDIPPVVLALAVADNTIYVGGGLITIIGGETRINLGAVDAATGAATPWAPSVGGIVNALAVSGGTVYVAADGDLVAIDAVSGAIDWNADPGGGGVSTLAISGNTIYAGGNFRTMGGQAHPGIAAIDRATGSAADWNPNLAGFPPLQPFPIVSAVATSGNVVYVGGGFSGADGQVSKQHLAALDATTANSLSWAPNADNGATALWPSGNTLYVGGDFHNICGQYHPNFAAITAACAPPTLTVSLSPSSLWPPNHKLANIHATVAAHDDEDPNPQVSLASITSNEPDAGTGSEDVPDDIQDAALGTADYDFELRAERVEDGAGRAYTVCYEARDACGNTTRQCEVVTVPHDHHAQAALATAAGQWTLTAYGSSILSARSIASSSVAVGTEDFEQALDATGPPEYSDMNGDGREDATFTLAGNLTPDVVASGKPFYARWTTDTDGYLAEISASSVTGVLDQTIPHYLQASVQTNPGHGSARIQFALPRSGQVRLVVYDVMGHQVARLIDGWRPAGWHTAPFEAGVSSQIYLYRLEWEGKAVTGKLAVLR
jgi:hypothetical protein